MYTRHSKLDFTDKGSYFALSPFQSSASLFFLCKPTKINKIFHLGQELQDIFQVRL